MKTHTVATWVLCVALTHELAAQSRDDNVAPFSIDQTLYLLPKINHGTLGEDSSNPEFPRLSTTSATREIGRFDSAGLSVVSHSAVIGNQSPAELEKAQVEYASQPLDDVARPEKLCGCDVCKTNCTHGHEGTCCGIRTCSCCQIVLPCQCARAGVYGGYEQTFVQPRFEDGQALRAGLIGSTITASVLGTTATLHTFYDQAEFDYGSAPRFFLGYVGPAGVGARAQYWWYDHESTTGQLQFANIVLPPAGLILPMGATVDISDSLSARLQLRAADAEFTHFAGFGSWLMSLGAGLRFASTQLDASNSVLASVTSGPVGNDATIRWSASREFDGIGPTISFDTERPFGSIVTDTSERRATEIRFFAKGRASLLYGELQSRTGLSYDDTVSVLSPLTGLAAPIALQISAADESMDVSTVLEAQIGFEFARQLKFPGRAFIRTALEAQIWQGAGGFQNLLGNPATLSAVTPFPHISK